MSNFSFALIVFAVLGSLCASLFAVRIAVRLRALPEARLKRIESGLSAVAESETELRETLQQLANKVKMMRVRNAINHTAEATSAQVDVGTIKDQLRRKAALVAGQPAPHK